MYNCETDCFTDIVGMRDVCEPATIKSCYWLNDIGISKHTIDQIVTKDFTDSEDFLTKQIQLSANQLANSIHTHFAGMYKSASIIEGMRIGFLQDNKVSKAGNNLWAGIYIECINSNSYLDFYLSEVVLTTDFTGNIPVKIYDVMTGTLLTTVTIASVAGKQSVLSINEILKSKRNSGKFFICYDTTGINSYQTNVKNSGCNGCNNSVYSNQYITARGMYSGTGTFILSDLTGSDHTFGMSLVYSLQCNHKDWICVNANILSLPLLYKIASNILLFGLQASPDTRVNNKVTINRERLELDQAFYEKKFIDQFESILASMQVPQDRKCFSCTTPYRTPLVLP
jgi:hypothetical protein